MIPTTNMIRNFFYASRSKSVRTVIVNGKVVLDDGVFTSINEREMFARIDAVSHVLLSRMGHIVQPNRLTRMDRPK